MLVTQQVCPADLISRTENSPNNDDWKDSLSFVNAKSLGHGGSGTVFEIDAERVIKVFADDEEGQMDLSREKEIFDKLQSGGGSAQVVKCIEQHGSGLVLERHAMTLRQCLKKLQPSSKHHFALQWAQQSCEGLSFLHENGVYHADVGCQNILLDDKGNAKICDFAGSKIFCPIEKDAWISYEPRSQHPEFSGQQPTVLTEIFAFGSVLFEIWTSRPPYVDQQTPEVRKKFIAGDFPLAEVKDINMRKIIGKCWKGDYTVVSEILAELKSLGRNC
jgi:serine/threonine protein kinase